MKLLPTIYIEMYGLEMTIETWRTKPCFLSLFQLSRMIRYINLDECILLIWFCALVVDSNWFCCSYCDDVDTLSQLIWLWVSLFMLSAKELNSVQRRLFSSSSITPYLQLVSSHSNRTLLLPFSSAYELNPLLLLVAAALMSAIYEENKDQDGFLYMTYSGENTFGSN